MAVTATIWKVEAAGVDCRAAAFTHSSLSGVAAPQPKKTKTKQTTRKLSWHMTDVAATSAAPFLLRGKGCGACHTLEVDE